MENNKRESFNWLGNVPTSWSIKKGKYLYKFIQTGKRDSGENNPDGLYPFFTCAKDPLSINKYSFDMEALLVSGNGIVGETKYFNGKFDAYQRVYVIGEFETEIFVPYLMYYMMNNFSIYLNWRMIGSVINFVKLEDIKNFDISFPNLEKQIRIYHFISRKVEQISKLIFNQERLINQLKDYKQSLIEHYFYNNVFEELDNRGDIPITAVPLRYACEIVRGNSTFKKDELSETGDYVGLQYGKTYKVDIIDETFASFVDKKFYKADQIVKRNDTIIISTSETIDELGHSCFYNRNDLGLLGGEQFVLKPNPEIIKGRYLYYCSVLFTKSLRKYSTGLKVYRFNLTHLRNVYIDIPTLSQQDEIIKIVDKKTEYINAVIHLKEKKLKLLNEYKLSLIYEYVTGKKEV